MIQRFFRARVIATYKNFSYQPGQCQREREGKLVPQAIYLYADARMTSFIESRSIKEIVPVGDPIKHQAPLIEGRHGILKEVVQQDLGFVGNKEM
jgi:hypothetical protein